MKLNKQIDVVEKALKEVFSKPLYIALAVFVSCVMLLFAIWLPNISFVGHVIQSPTFSTDGKLSILWHSLGAIKTNFTLFSRTSTILISLLTGMNIAMFTYYMSKRFRLEKSAGTSLAGIIMGLFGVGCASCGSVILSSIFGVGTATGFIGVLPLRGSEFGILGVLLLSSANYHLTRKITEPLSCSIDTARS